MASGGSQECVIVSCESPVMTSGNGLSESEFIILVQSQMEQGNRGRWYDMGKALDAEITQSYPSQAEQISDQSLIKVGTGS